MALTIIHEIVRFIIWIAPSQNPESQNLEHPKPRKKINLSEWKSKKWSKPSRGDWQAYFLRSLVISWSEGIYWSLDLDRCTWVNLFRFLKKLARIRDHRSWSPFQSWIIIGNPIFTWKYSEIWTKMPPLVLGLVLQKIPSLVQVLGP